MPHFGQEKFSEKTRSLLVESFIITMPLPIFKANSIDSFNLLSTFLSLLNGQ